MKRKHLTIMIKDIEWKVFLLNPAYYERREGKDSEGVTYPEAQEIYLNKRFFSPRTIRHELLHAYFSSTNTETAKLDADQAEEVCASIVGNHFDAIAAHCSAILEFFKGH